MARGSTRSPERASGRTPRDARWWRPRERLRVGVSSCLLGSEVRWDGGHKRDAWVCDQLGAFVEWVPVCPELELGLGVPRPTLRLEGEEDELRLIEKGGRDLSGAMRRFARRRAVALAREGLCGYVFKKDSPSCGLERVKVYRPNGPGERRGTGLFAEAVRQRLPLLPCEEEGRLRDARLRDNFVERLFAFWRLEALFGARWTVGDLVAFHTAHKLQLLAHHPEGYRALGRMVAGARKERPAALRDAYRKAFMRILEHAATPRRHANVLEHALGHLRPSVPAADRAELSDLIHEHRRGLVPLIVPITLLRHHVRREGIAYLDGQLYLEPHPKELMLRNHV